MTGHDINSFRTLNESQISALSFRELEITGIYSQNGILQNKIEFKKGSSISEIISDSQNEFFADTENWDPLDSDIQIIQSFSIETGALLSLFKDENKLADSEDVLGLFVKWRFEPASILGTEEADYSNLTTFTEKELTNTKEEKINFKITLNYKKGEYGGALKLNYYLFLKKKKSAPQNGIATENGTLLGNLNDEIIIRFHGEGSAFPLSFTENNNEKYLLWDVNLPGSASDLNNLPFTEEHIGIVINKSHQSYINLNDDENKFITTDLFKEVFSSALEHILYELYLMFKAESSTLDDSFFEESIENSIAMFFYNYMTYLFEEKNILKTIRDEDISIEEFHKKIREYVEKQMDKIGNKR